MSLIASANGASKVPPLEQGTYPAVCCGLFDIGEQYSELFDKSTHKIVIQWEIPSETIETESGLKPRVQSETYTLSLNEKAALRKVLESWRGRQFTEDELKEFDLRNILGVGCLITVIHRDGSNGNTYANVGSVAKLPKGFAAPIGTIAPVSFDLDDPDAYEKLGDLPEWLQKRVKNSNEYKAYEAALAAADTAAFTDITTDDIPFLPEE